MGNDHIFSKAEADDMWKKWCNVSTSRTLCIMEEHGRRFLTCRAEDKWILYGCEHGGGLYRCKDGRGLYRCKDVVGNLYGWRQGWWWAVWEGYRLYAQTISP